MKRARDGFTLIELLIIIVIVGVISAVLIPNLLQARLRANDTAAAGCAKQLASSQEFVFIEAHVYASSLAALNAATQGMADNCEAPWVDDTAPFASGWDVGHPNGTGLVYVVEPGGIIPPP